MTSDLWTLESFTWGRTFQLERQFNDYHVSFYSKLGIALGAENSSMNKSGKKNPCPHNAYILVVGKRIQETIIKR